MPPSSRPGSRLRTVDLALDLRSASVEMPELVITKRRGRSRQRRRPGSCRPTSGAWRSRAGASRLPAGRPKATPALRLDPVRAGADRAAPAARAAGRPHGRPQPRRRALARPGRYRPPRPAAAPAAGAAGRPAAMPPTHAGFPGPGHRAPATPGRCAVLQPRRHRRAAQRHLAVRQAQRATSRTARSASISTRRRGRPPPSCAAATPAG